MKTLLLMIGLLILPFFVNNGFTDKAKRIVSERIVIDQSGQKVILSTNPKRVVSLAPSITEVIFSIKQEKKLVGVTIYSDYPPEAKKMPKVGSYVNLDLEKIVSLKPDLCIAVKEGNPEEIINRLKSFNIPIYIVNPYNMDMVIETIIKIGSLLNATDQTKIVTDNMRQRLDKIKTLVSKIDYRPGVFVQIGVSPIVSAGTKTFINELIVLAGGKNLAQGNIIYPRLSMEQVLNLNPEILIITTMARNTIFDNVKKEWSKWPDINAVKNNKIFLADSDILNRPTLRLIDGLELLFSIIHPQDCKEY